MAMLALVALLAACRDPRPAVVLEAGPEEPFDLAVPDLAARDLSPSLDLIDAAPAGPALDAIAPSTIMAGAADTTLTLSGARFDSTARVLVDDGTQAQPLATSFVSAAQLAAQLPAQLTTDAIVYQVRVQVGAATSPPQPLTVENAQPVITQLAPSSAPAGGSAFTLAVAGGAFSPSSTVHAGATALTTRFVSRTRLDADVPASLLQQAGPVAITVVSRAPGGGTSPAQTLTVTNCTGAPILTALMPQSAAVGSSFTLTAQGGCFVCGAASATLLLDGSAQATTLGACSGGFTDNASAALANLSAGTHTVLVRNPDGSTSSTLPLGIVQPNPAPTLASVSPMQAIEGGPAFTLSATGTGFVDGVTVLRWNGSARPTTVQSATSLQAAIGAADVAQAATVMLTVFNPTPGGGTSSPLGFGIVKAPVIASLSPSSVLAGASPPVVQVLGANFLSGATATFGGNARAVSFVSSGRLDLTLVAGDTTSPGSFGVQVANPGAVLSNTLAFQVQNPQPSVSAVTPCGLPAGQATTLTIDVACFVGGASVSVAGAALAVSSLSANRIVGTVTVPSAPAGDVGALVVTNPAPSAGASAPIGLGVATQAVTASMLESGVYAQGCATPNCHLGNDTQLPGSLDLRPGRSLAQLVGVVSDLCGPKQRVVRCDPSRSASYLVDKILSVSGARACNNDPGSAGFEMPPTSAGAPGITAAQQQMIIDWVAQGAP